MILKKLTLASPTILFSIIFIFFVSAQNAEGLVIFSDNYSSSSEWTQVGTEVYISNGHVVIDGIDGSDHHIYRSLGSTINNVTAFKLDFDFNFTAADNPAHYIIAISNDTISPGFAGNLLGVGMGIEGNNLAIAYSHLPDIPRFSTSNIPILTNTKYYVTLERLNSTTAKLSVFTDSARTFQIFGSPIHQTISSELTGLSTVVTGTVEQGCTCRSLTAYLDNVVISSSQITHMEDRTSSFGLSVYSGRQIQAEFVSTTSQLIGDQIDTITLKLKKVGSPTGTATIGVFNTDLTVKKEFGTIDVSTIVGIYPEYTFALPSEQTYQIGSGDRIGIKYTGGNSANYIGVMTDNKIADPFDGQNTYHQFYTTKWTKFLNNDLYLILKQTH